MIEQREHGATREVKVLRRPGVYQCTHEDSGKRFSVVVAQPVWLPTVQKWNAYAESWAIETVNWVNWSAATPAPSRWERMKGWLGLTQVRLPEARVVER